MDDKERAAAEKKEKQKMHDMIDRNLRGVKRELEIHKLREDTTGYWKYWSKAVERGFLQFLDESKVFNRKTKGRGEPISIKVKPEEKGAKPGNDSTRELKARRPRKPSGKPGGANSSRLGLG